MEKGEFGLVYIDEEGVVYPAYLKGENRETFNFLVEGGMFGEEIVVDKDTPLGRKKND